MAGESEAPLDIHVFEPSLPSTSYSSTTKPLSTPSLWTKLIMSAGPSRSYSIHSHRTPSRTLPTTITSSQTYPRDEYRPSSPRSRYTEATLNMFPLQHGKDRPKHTGRYIKNLILSLQMNDHSIERVIQLDHKRTASNFYPGPDRDFEPKRLLLIIKSEKRFYPTHPELDFIRTSNGDLNFFRLSINQSRSILNAQFTFSSTDQQTLKANRTHRYTRATGFNSPGIGPTSSSHPPLLHISGTHSSNNPVYGGSYD
ncbi:hypothetical protein B0T20DRAFT_479206 [Sordaria brevicollis]|uniref:Uncharacterized protein n=1 Tax=Sordaria brevicollis TaxID=83679 RepID=A0AAE0PEF2_SORBR|nr:hypothetical protein B0T20DRAFT_479206 [Sordaria brevicollis]